MLDSIKNDEHLNLIISNWLYELISSYPQNRDEEAMESACVDNLAKIHKLITPIQETDDITVRGVLGRAVIEIVSDMFTLYREEDPNKAAQIYLNHHYEGYKKLHENLNSAIKNNSFPFGKRIFDNQAQNWTSIGLTKRVQNMDKIKQALNDYDLFSHYVHYGGSGSTVILDNIVKQTIFGRINYQIVFAVIISSEFKVLTKSQLSSFIRICNGTVGEALRYGNFQRNPVACFRDTNEHWPYPIENSSAKINK